MFLISLCIVRDQKKRAALESRAGTSLSLTARVSVEHFNRIKHVLRDLVVRFRTA